MKSILFIDINGSSFIRNDELILSEKYNILKFTFKHKKGFKLLIDLIRQKLFLIKNIFKAEAIYVWFADYNAVLPSIFGWLFRKKVFIVIGGFDAAYKPEINYGINTRLIGKLSAKISTFLSYKLIAVSEFTKNELLKNINSKLKSKTVVIHNCFTSNFECNKPNPAEGDICLVSFAADDNRIKVKSIDFFVEVARAMPEKKFKLIGISGKAFDKLNRIKSENLEILPPKNQDELKEILCNAKIICQFSRYESFGIAILEGIFTNCYPVGYNYAGTAEVIGEDGILIDELNVNQATDAIKRAYSKTQDDIDIIKSIMKNKFAFNVRKEKILRVFER